MNSVDMLFLVSAMLVIAGHRRNSNAFFWAGIMGMVMAFTAKWGLL